MSKQTLKLISLNIEKYHHIPLVLELLRTEKPDIICLQEIFEETFESFKQELGMNGVFCHQVIYKTDEGVGHSEGLAILSTLPITESQAIPYTQTKEDETSEIATTDLPEDNTDRSYINKQHHRKLLVATIQNGEESWHISTTHFTWAYYGHFDKENKRFIWRIDESTIDEQVGDAERLFDVFGTFPDLVFCADLNAPRGERVFGMFSDKLKDNIPDVYRTSIDVNIHRAGMPLPLMVDGVFTTPEYSVTNVVLKDGISDHMAVVCEIYK